MKKKLLNQNMLTKIGIVLLVLLSVMFLDSFYGTQSPNYYALRKEADTFTAPENWQFEGNRENRGQLGLWCIQLGGTLCPFYTQTYLADKPATRDEVVGVLRSVTSSMELSAASESFGLCFADDFDLATFTCTIDGESGSVKVSVSATTNQVESGKMRYAIQYSR